MIVKVQLSLMTTATKRRVFVYNRDQSIMFEGELTPEVECRVGDEPKSFWHAHLNKKKQIVLDKKAKWQDW